jgi:RsiW-degrading membrane proteinase PrsW (M82 family)
MASPPGGHKMNRSTLFPLLAGRSGLVGKTQLIPIIVTIIVGFGLAVASIPLKLWIIGGYITFLTTYFVYMLCGRKRPWLVIGVFIVMALLFAGPLGFIAAAYNGLFIGERLDTFLATASSSRRILTAFFGPGLSEELWKALPVLVLAYVAHRWRTPITQRIGIFEPLDGILVGVASAAAFAVTETMGVYVAQAVGHAFESWFNQGLNMFCPHVHNGQDLLINETCKQQAIEFARKIGRGDALSAALLTILTRGIPEITGHIAWSGVFGYFIGLAALKTSSAVRIVIIGWLSAAALHGAWDSVSFGAYSSNAAVTVGLLFLVAALSYVFLGSVILKARKISPLRAENFATVSLATPAPQTDPAAWFQPAPQPLPSTPRARSPAPAAEAVAAAPLVLKIGPVTRVLSAGASIEPLHLGTAGAGRGKGSIAEIVVNPREPGVLGLRNLSDRVYRAQLPTGKAIDLPRDRTVRLAPGVVIDFGGIEGVVLTQEAAQKSSKA